jgi:hypothetical protein
MYLDIDVLQTLASAGMPCVQHVVFGELLEGQKVLNRLETEAGSSDGEPKVSVVVEDCGEL